jgi:hypothetical protein
MTVDLQFSNVELLLCRAVADTEDALRAAAAHELRRELGDDKLLALTAKNDVTPHVAHALIKDNPSAELLTPWHAAHERNAQRISAYLQELDAIAALLGRDGIPLVALKNGGIARGIYPCPGCCPMGDLDVLVEKRHFRRAHRLLLAESYNFEFRSPLEEAELEAAEQGGGGEYWKMLPGGEKLWFELQWRPVAGRWIRPDQEPSAEELMARSVPIEGTAVRLLSPEDNLLQVALHTAKHTYVRAPGFRLHTDVDRIARRQPVDWQLFLKRVHKLQVKTAVYFSLAIPQMLFDTPIPEDVLREIKPTRRKEQLIARWLQRAGIFNPDEQKFSSPGYIAFTSLLYDDLSGLRRALLPDSEWMHERYGFSNKLLLPYYHVRRMADLAFKRVLS